MNSQGFITRTLWVLPQAALVTFWLLWLMAQLISSADSEIDQQQRIRLPDILMPESEIETRRLIKKPNKPETKQSTPPDIPEQQFDRYNATDAIGIAPPKLDSGNLDLNLGGGLKASDGEYLPIVKVAPQYPRMALSRGIEGYVILEYKVTQQGTVKDIKVVESKPPRIFNKSAIRSAKRYKYKPRVENGKAIEVPGVRTKISYELER